MVVAQWRRKDFDPNPAKTYYQGGGVRCEFNTDNFYSLLPKEFWVAAGYLDGQTDILTEAEGREKDA